MPARAPFVLLDDARSSGAATARLYRDPACLFIAQHPDEVAPALAAATEALGLHGGHLTGYIAYEAGLVLEPRLRPLAARRAGAAGPLVWLGLFADEQRLAPDAVPGWLAENADPGAIAPTLGPLEPQLSRKGHGAAVAQVQEAIAAGDVYQVNLTFPLAGGFTGDPAALYALLRPAAAAGYGALVFDGSHWLLSLSPELFVSVGPDGALTARPMKGTRARGTDPAADAALRDELARSDKDRAENLMIVDLMRNDLGRIAAEGSVVADAPFQVETYPTVHQMVSEVRARLRPDVGPEALLAALFPCGSVTGAPKIRAMEIINAVERDARGPYCGAIGRISAAPGGTGAGWEAAFNVAIRTLRLTPIENGRGKAVLGVGSAILADSDPDAEWRECILKGAFARAGSPAHRAGLCDLIETMRFDPEEGIPLLDAHLSRLRDSAAALGLSFDRHDARNHIHALCFSLDAPMCVRLVAGRSGTVALEARPLPAPWPEPARVMLLPLPVDPGDWRLRHKTSDRSFYEAAQAEARAGGADEAVFIGPDGLITEGAVSNVFLRREDGILATPPAALGLLPGVLRGELLGRGDAREEALRAEDLASGFLLGNSLRGLVPARLIP